MLKQTPWRKSLRSAGNGNCVQVAGREDGMILVRDDKDPDGPVQEYTRQEWLDFIADAKEGRFDYDEVMAGLRGAQVTQ
ncbi:DUF397 domain-containing protein [Microtetraspora fusca]|uniref:DUF397 domain-containing protein n=1 Tax=Microtetraspora fusca TaxID=1997 RepID=A0ABW6VHH8_MICFU